MHCTLSALAVSDGILWKQEGETFEMVIPAGTVLEESLSISCTDARSTLSIHLGRGAKVILSMTMEEHVEEQMTEVILEDESSLEFVCLQNTSGQKTVIKQEAKVGSGAMLRMQNLSLGTSELDHQLRSETIGANAQSSIDWVFYARDTEKQMLSVRNVFTAPGGSGEILMKGVAEEKAHVSAKGMIEIGEKGNETNTYLTQNVLMLDSTAKVDAVPGLEIRTNDVKASHSATVSRVTPEDLFYFASRGIEKREARKMYITGFLGDITQRISDPSMRERLLAALEDKYDRA